MRRNWCGTSVRRCHPSHILLYSPVLRDGRLPSPPLWQASNGHCGVYSLLSPCSSLTQCTLQIPVLLSENRTPSSTRFDHLFVSYNFEAVSSRAGSCKIYLLPPAALSRTDGFRKDNFLRLGCDHLLGHALNEFFDRPRCSSIRIIMLSKYYLLSSAPLWPLGISTSTMSVPPRRRGGSRMMLQNILRIFSRPLPWSQQARLLRSEFRRSGGPFSAWRRSLPV